MLNYLDTSARHRRSVLEDTVRAVPCLWMANEGPDILAGITGRLTASSSRSVDDSSSPSAATRSHSPESTDSPSTGSAETPWCPIAPDECLRADNFPGGEVHCPVQFQRSKMVWPLSASARSGTTAAPGAESRRQPTSPGRSSALPSVPAGFRSCGGPMEPPWIQPHGGNEHSHVGDGVPIRVHMCERRQGGNCCAVRSTVCPSMWLR